MPAAKRLIPLAITIGLTASALAQPPGPGPAGPGGPGAFRGFGGALPDTLQPPQDFASSAEHYAFLQQHYDGGGSHSHTYLTFDDGFEDFIF